jgi:F0F1-type ATP synthase assembly protein I
MKIKRKEISMILGLAIGFIAGIVTTIILSCMVVSGECSREEEKDELNHK